MTIGLGLSASAQDGMDHNLPAPSSGFAGLRFDGFSIINTLFNNEKALGVYQTKTIAPVSFLEVNSNPGMMPQPLPSLAGNLGEVFSTNSGTPLNSFWRMRKQNLEYGVIFNNLSNNNFNMQATRAKLWFLTNSVILPTTTPVNRVLIDDVTTDGSIGMGNNLPLTFVPQSRLHLDITTVTDVDMRFTNASSGNLFTDGFRIGMNPLATIARLAMLEPTGSMNFATGSPIADRMKIIPNGRVLINPNSLVPIPNNRLEITSDVTDPKPAGLRFTNLTCAGPLDVQCNPLAPVFLSVDANGDVILVGGGTGMILGNSCTAPGSNPLTTDWEIPLNNNDFFFSDPSGNTGSVSIGTNNCASTITTRLDVINDSKNGAGLFVTRIISTLGAVGLRGECTNNGTGGSLGLSGVSFLSGGNSIGVAGASQGTTSPTAFAIGVNARSGSTSAQNIGVNSIALNGTTYSIAGNFDVIGSTSPANYGLQVEVMSNTGSVNNYGGQFIVNGNNAGSNNYGVYSDCGPSSGNTPPTGPNYAGYFNGDVLVTGTFGVTSDASIKKDVKNIDKALDILGQLQPKTYSFDQTVHPQIHLPGQKQYGVIAQEVEKVLPELIVPIHHPALYDSLGKEISPAVDLKGVNYQGFIALLMQGMKEQQDMIEDQQKQINELKSLVGGSQLPGNNGAGNNSTSQNIELSDKNVVVLNQNVPNPFAEQTVISYNIPGNTGFAQIIFYNSMGQLIKAIDIREKGKGQLNVFANDLSSGTYTYSLVVDGKVIDSKKMTKTE